MEGFKPPERSPEEEGKSRNYKLESGIDAVVSSKCFYPQKKVPGIESQHNAIVFLPGLNMDPGASMLKNLGNAYAESSGEETHILKVELSKEAENKKIKEIDLFYEEALAVSKFIKEKGFSQVTLVGYSIGGPRVINLVHILQDDSSLNVNGVILLGSPGLYEQDPGELKKNLLKDSLATPLEVLKRQKVVRSFMRGFNAMVDVGSSLFINSLGTDFRIRIKRDFSEMEHFNPRISEIKVPVVVVVGTLDRVIEVNKIIPPVEIENIQRSVDDSVVLAREKYLKENLFKNSPYVRMVTPTKMGKHGLPVFRPEQVANVSIGLLQRYHRQDRNNST